MAITQRRPIAIRILIALQLFQAFSGIGGGYGLAADPTGAAVGLDPEWLEGSPFADYLIPGIILLVVLGIGPLIVVIGIFRRLRWAWMASLLVGLALIIWIIVEVFIVGYISQPPLQLVYGLVGFGIIARPFCHQCGAISGEDLVLSANQAPRRRERLPCLRGLAILGTPMSEAGLAVFVLVAFLLPVPLLVWLDHVPSRSGRR